MQDKMLERFFRYVKVDTQSDSTSPTQPSTAKQLDLGRMLAKECEEMGLCEAHMDEHGYVTAYLPSNLDHDVPVVAFLAHMDTSQDYSGTDVLPQLIKNYDGNDIVLKGLTISPDEFPKLKNLVGKDLVTSDGTTLLGADDKAGIAEIMTAMEYLINNPHIKHGKVCVGFTPDEEIGRGVDKFDVKKFGADFGYTLDGGTAPMITFETFNAATATFRIIGKSVHPGQATNVMINSQLIAADLIQSFPDDETPAKTAGYDGFYHLTTMKGNCAETELVYIVRDHDTATFEKRKAFTVELAKKFNEKYGEGTVILNVVDSYYNMKEALDKEPHVFGILKEAIESLGMTPISEPARGGTDGSRLSFMGLPCPNFFTGGGNGHGPYEYCCVQDMEKAVEVTLKIIELVSQK